ncbi:MAG: serine/threonine protein kinase [Deltaproteobacteria bacterium]|nr:serine/threonine protein kinase [Deltaproteobacteria bacterium]
MDGGVAEPAPAVRPVSPGDPPPWSAPLGEFIGSGGFASVWEISGERVLKVAHADHELARARMAREAEALAAIGAPAVPQLTGHGVLADGRAWIAMERITGVTLGDVIAAGPGIEDVISVSLRILDGLSRIHAAGFAHRDLKPDNLVRRPDGAIVILDLGLARKVPVDGDDPNRAGVQIGSIEYMAPEQLLDATTAGVSADLYAFGCILYELCATRPPFVGDRPALERAHAALRPPPLGTLANVPAALEQLCHDCLAKQPLRRPASAAEVAARLREVGRVLSPQRTQHGRSVIRESTQPVVLLWAELPRVDRALLATLAARKIAVISQRGRRVLGAVVGAAHADPAGAAIAAARELADAGARVALHLDALVVTPQAAGFVLAGPGVERPEGWLPATSWTGVVMTHAFASVTQVATHPADVGPGFAMLGELGKSTDGNTELFGRDAVVAELVTDAAAAIAGSGPALAVLVGEPGIGKTALVAALVPRLTELGIRVHVGTVPPPGSGRPGHRALFELVGTPQGPVVRAVGDAIRAAARQQPLAILLDDLHLAEHELLDALEYATLGGEPLPLWILGLAAPRLDQRRPDFGSRAERRRRDVLPPLDEEAAVAMASALLRPAEYPPLRALRQIAAIARGNPMHLSTIAREIHERGAIRMRPVGPSPSGEASRHFLDTTVLDALPPIALGPWLAARELAPLGDELVALARVCAVLGDQIDRDELAAVVDVVERRGGATTNLDVDIGLAELTTAQILITVEGHWVFRQALLEEGVYATTNLDERRELHKAALAYWQARPSHEPAAAARIARHAEAVGERRVAAAAFATLGEHARRDHRELDADQAWQGAVRNLDDRDLARGRALLGRARARYRLQRVRDALADLDETIAIASELGDALLEIEALLEKATALDWSDEFEASARVADQARARLQTTASGSLELEAALADGRTAFRRQQFEQAVDQLQGVVPAALAIQHTEVATIARLLLAPALVELGALDAAERVFGELIAMCEAGDDRFHLGVAYANRAWLWSKRGDVEQTARDLRVVIQLAREGGQPTLERIVTYNLAEDRLWQGAFDEALQLARRCLAIQRGHGEGSVAFDQLLLARVLAARGDRDELGRVIESLRAAELSESDRLVVDVLSCACEDRTFDHWQLALLAAQRLAADVRIELAHLALASGVLPEPLRGELRELATRHPIWARRSEL